MKDEFYTQNDLAEIFHISPRTLERKRVDGSGPPFVKFGRRVLYRRSQVESWIEASCFGSTTTIKRGRSDQSACQSTSEASS
jgi:hypothetical protein